MELHTRLGGWITWNCNGVIIAVAGKGHSRYGDKAAYTGYYRR